MKSSLYYEELTQIGLLAKEIKKGLIRHSTNPNVSYRDIIEYVQNTLSENGFEPAFPTLVLPDKRVSNWTPLQKQFDSKVDSKVCLTIDFGIQSKNGAIIDTAFTSFTDIEHQEKFYNSYKKIYKQIICFIEKQLEQNKSVFIPKLTNFIHFAFKDSPVKVMYSCDAHKILPFILHSSGIPMAFKNDYCQPSLKGDYLLEGDVFTIEPHVVFSPNKQYNFANETNEIKLVVSDSNIRGNWTTNQIDTVDNRLQKDLLKYGPSFYFSYETHTISSKYKDACAFYIQETFTIKDNKLVQIT